jgi:hypothetical protein
MNLKITALAAALALATTTAQAQTNNHPDCSKAAQRVLAQCLYGSTDDDFIHAWDRYAQPRSVEQYRRIVPNAADI